MSARLERGNLRYDNASGLNIGQGIAMTKTHSNRSGDGSESELDSIRSNRANKLGAILCPAICALFLVCIFAVSFVGTKMAYEQYDSICRTRYDVYRLKKYFTKFNVTEPKLTGADVIVVRPV